MKWLPLVPLLFLLCQCGTHFSAKCWGVPRESRVPAGDLMIQARAAWKQMELNLTQEAAASYNLATSRLFDQLHCGQADWDRKAAEFQVLFFSYPTGIAWPYNAAEFRRQMRKVRDYAAKRGSLDNWNKMAVVGHSMGGVILQSFIPTSY